MAKRTIVEILLQAKDATGRALGAVGGRLRSLRDSIFSLRTAAAAFAAFITTRVVGQVVKAFADQEAAIIRLNTALRVTGRFTEAGTRRIQAMANEMQRLTTVSDDAALGISATLAQLATGLDTDQLAEAQKIAIGLASAFGLDLQSAAQLLGKTLAGEMNALSRYNIRVDEAAGQQQKFNQIVAQTSRFFDVAVGATQSLTGQWAQAKNAAGELLETFGEILARTFNLTEAQGSLRDRLTSLNEQIRANLPEWVKWGGVVGGVLHAVIRTLGNVVKFFFNTGEVIGDVFDVAAQLVRVEFTKLYNFLVDWINKVLTAFNAIPLLADIPLLSPMLGGGAVQALEDAKERLQQDAQDIRDAIGGIGDAWSDVAKLIKATPLPIPDSATAGGGPNGALTPAQIAAEQARTRLGESTRTLSRFAAGQIPTAEFESDMSRLVPQLQTLRDSGLLDQAQWTAVTQAIEKFREEAEKAGILITSFVDVGSSSFGQAFAQNVAAASDALGTLNEQLASTSLDALGGFTSAATDAFGALTEGSQEAGKAFQAAMLDALANVASQYAEMFAARATGALAEGLLGHPAAFKSAALFLAAAAAMSALAGALRGASNRTAGGAGGGGGAAGAQERTNEVARERQQGTINVSGEWWPGDPRFVDRLAVAVNEMIERGVSNVKITYDK